MQYHLPYIHGKSWICRFIQQPHFQLFSLSLPALLRSGSITGQNIEYKMENSPLFLEVSRSHLKEGPDNDCFVCLFFDLSYVMDRTLSQISRDFSLTNREVNVLSLLLRGYSNDQISSTLFVSIPTVKKHLASIYSKMEIKSQKQILERIHFYDK